MNVDVLIALSGFMFVTSMTPGPNNIMLLASGVNFGFRRTLPHMGGVVFGFLFMLLCIAVGLGQLLERAPAIYRVLKFLGGAYLVYLAYKIAMSGPMESDGEASRPLTFWAAAAFQWVNPKAWVATVTAVATYSDVTHYTNTVLIVAFVSFLASLLSVSSWTFFGTTLRGLLSNPLTLRRFNITMGLLLVASLWPMLR